MDKDKVDRCDRPGHPARSLVFCQTKRVCDRVGDQPARSRRRRIAAIHGDLPQSRARAGAAQVRRGQAGDAGRHRCGRPRHRHRRHRRRHPLRAGQGRQGLPPPVAAARRVPASDGWAVTLAEYNQHTQMRILQRALRLPTDASRSRSSRTTRSSATCRRSTPTSSPPPRPPWTDVRRAGLSPARPGGAASKSVDLVGVGRA